LLAGSRPSRRQVYQRTVDAGDGTVDFTDLGQVVDNMGSACDTPEACPEDVDGNGVVNIFDVLAVFTHLGPCP